MSLRVSANSDNTHEKSLALSRHRAFLALANAKTTALQASPAPFVPFVPFVPQHQTPKSVTSSVVTDSFKNMGLESHGGGANVAVNEGGIVAGSGKRAPPDYETDSGPPLPPPPPLRAPPNSNDNYDEMQAGMFPGGEDQTAIQLRNATGLVETIRAMSLESQDQIKTVMKLLTSANAQVGEIKGPLSSEQQQQKSALAQRITDLIAQTQQTKRTLELALMERQQAAAAKRSAELEEKLKIASDPAYAAEKAAEAKAAKAAKAAATKKANQEAALQLAMTTSEGRAAAEAKAKVAEEKAAKAQAMEEEKQRILSDPEYAAKKKAEKDAARAAKTAATKKAKKEAYLETPEGKAEILAKANAAAEKAAADKAAAEEKAAAKVAAEAALVEKKTYAASAEGQAEAERVRKEAAAKAAATRKANADAKKKEEAEEKAKRVAQEAENAEREHERAVAVYSIETLYQLRWNLHQSMLKELNELMDTLETSTLDEAKACLDLQWVNDLKTVLKHCSTMEQIAGPPEYDANDPANVDPLTESDYTHYVQKFNEGYDPIDPNAETDDGSDAGDGEANWMDDERPLTEEV